MKHMPTVGEHLYTYQPCNNMWIAEVRRPWTVEEVITENMIIIREAKAVFNGAQYYNTLPDDIVDDPNGRRMTMRYSKKKHRWQESPDTTGYPQVAVFGMWDWQPYLD